MERAEDGSNDNKGIRIHEERMKKTSFVWCYKHVRNFKFMCGAGSFLSPQFFLYVFLEMLSLFHCKSKQVKLGIKLGDFDCLTVITWITKTGSEICHW